MATSSFSDAGSHELQKPYHETTVSALPNQHVGEEVDDDYHDFNRGYTRNDQVDMGRMGKAQELRRNYRPLSAIAFTVILQGTATTQGLTDSGVAGLIWSFIWTFVGFSFVMASLAEMASMAPTSGGQYHWVSEFAPPRYQKIMSYFIGWMSTLSWQAGTASGPFLVGNLIQSCAIVMYLSYSPTNYQGTLMVIAVTVIVWALNVYGTKTMPLVQNIMLVVYVCGFLAIIIVLWVLAPRNSAKTTFTQFTNEGGWSTMGLSLMVGQISAIYACICSNAAAYMSEEIKYAGMTVPRAIVSAYLLNGALGLVFLISNPTYYPHIWVFRQAVSSGSVAALNVILTVLIFAGTVSFNLSTSRQTWAFARDHGLPFSAWIGHVSPILQVPANAVTVTSAITIALSLINISSDVAFNAIISLNVVSLMITHIFSIGCVLYRRSRHPELLPKCQWSLGRLHAFFWCFWPNATPVTAVDFNWAVVMFVGLAGIAAVDYVIRARHVYKGPVVLVEGWKGE
ncbi:GABA permease-like protein [Mytilinidion resinicola]|uniref:GABA permease-like protein n=1 Tax=Mytilinidion resinicola TaxID=574789 RepID=A0A6A6YLC2_9PEZI|nr:GABA permease-like protein [Mytilinidion resinicola]KAF2808667.1 GABA permease-like protein [Mytilinidion resinicola]